MSETPTPGLPPDARREALRLKMTRRPLGASGRLAKAFLESKLTPLLVVASLLLGVFAVLITPREEEPQIKVPMIDVLVAMPGASPEEVERRVVAPVEKALYQIPNVEYVYSMSRAGQAIITVRYYVGEDRERSLVKLYKRIDENIDLVPPGVTGWVVKPVEIDDVPIMTLTLTSATADEYALRRVAEELVERLAAVKNTSRAYVVGGQPRTVYVYLSPDRMQAYSVSPLEVRRAIEAANVTQTAGDFARHDELTRVEAGRPLPEGSMTPVAVRDLAASSAGLPAVPPPAGPEA